MQTLKELLQAPELQLLLTEPPNFEAVATTINAVSMVPNPVPQQQVAVPPTLQDVLGLVTPQERFAIGETESYKRILDAISQSRFDWVVDNLTTLLGGGVISQDSFNSIVTVLSTSDMMPDPSYQPLVPGQSLAQQSGLGRVDAGQVMLAYLS